MKIENLSIGQVVFDVHKYRMGNTKISTVGIWPVRIVEIDLEKQKVRATWNGNYPETFFGNKWSKWRAARPELIRNRIGQSRLATKKDKPTQPA